ncbi:hypothetical protein SGPA1_21933 [Streptomyces misionensis JCM 4497]
MAVRQQRGRLPRRHDLLGRFRQRRLGVLPERAVGGRCHERFHPHGRRRLLHLAGGGVRTAGQPGDGRPDHSDAGRYVGSVPGPAGCGDQRADRRQRGLGHADRHLHRRHHRQGRGRVLGLDAQRRFHEADDGRHHGRHDRLPEHRQRRPGRREDLCLRHEDPARRGQAGGLDHPAGDGLVGQRPPVRLRLRPVRTGGH